MKKLLAIDIGNTTTAIGVFNDEELTDSWRLTTKVLRTPDETWLALSQLLNIAKKEANGFDKIAISSVVPDQTTIYSSLAKNKFGKNPLIISHEHVPYIEIAYTPPKAVGADRICGIAAGYKKYGAPLIVIDMGTATVFDVLNEKKTYLGGLIAPGLLTAVDSLHKAAAQLPKVELSFPSSVIGQNTETAIQSGILYGALAMIDGIVQRIQNELNKKATVIATGGFANLLLPHSSSIQYIEPNLVLEGIQIIASEQ